MRIKLLFFSLLISVGAQSQMVFNNTLLKIDDNVPLLNQVTSRTAFVPFTDAVNNDWQGRYYPVKLGGDTIVSVWMEGTFHSDYNSASHKTNIHFSADAGATWTTNNTYFGGGAISGWPLVPPDVGAGFVDFNFFEVANGDLILHAQSRGTNVTAWNGVNFSIHQYRSTDRGATWSYDADFAGLCGYSTIAAKAKVQGEFETVRVGSVTYVIFCDIRTDLDDTKIRIFSTDDNATTWDFVYDVVAYDEADPDVTESSISYIGGGDFFFVFRSQDLGTGYYKRCNDFFNSCTTLTTFSDELDYVGVHQPHIDDFSRFTLLTGRDNKRIIGDPTAYFFQRNSFWITPDYFSTISRRQYLDPFYTGNGTLNDGDAGYTRAVQLDKDNFLFFGYYGTNSAALIYKYEVSHTNTPSQEQYSNTTYFPSTITSSGLRLQMNRDGTQSTSPPTVLRFHNSLTSGNNVWTVAGTAPEFVVQDNEGWGQFTAGRALSGSTLPNLLFRASFSVGFWLDPDDGQPAAAQIPFRCSNQTNTTNDDIVVIQLQTDGKILCRYGANGSLATLIPASAIFSDGNSTAHHISMTVTSGDKIRLYVDGSLVTDDGTNTGSMSGVTMTNFSTTNPVYVGQRQTGASTFDLPYTGRIREVVAQPVVWSAGDVLNIMSN